MGYPLAGGELELACDLVSSRIAWLDVRVGPGDAASGLLVPTGPVAGGTPRGTDLLATWRGVVDRSWQRLYGAPQPPHVATTFVLGWYLDALAQPAAWAATLGPWLLDVSPGAVTVQAHPTQGFLQGVWLDPAGAHQVVAAQAVRERRAEAAYRAHAEQVARAYAAPGVRMSSRQRLGLVDDHWRMALERARAGAGSPVTTRTGDLGQGRSRTSCCFIYALPGATACSTCPRRATRPTPARRA